jgi:hypothetical protein
VAAFGAAGAGKAVGEDAAFEVAAEFPFDMGRRKAALPGVTGVFEPGRQVGSARCGRVGCVRAGDGDRARCEVTRRRQA